ncbi:CopG family transcriptional regulator [Sphingomonas sp. LaA6.9]|uniref:ribbon-helix-helix domain-containing protein n=1 Tax=Sphingomonas sp. LaA6.9 TaxID=2919914 RepID=UPI001F503BE6|nr:CopG family transcriptional regulator [Sphingomonas sp. LaA6.9]MCJ8158883.1 ribbon-helix-helix domain-containing protein [Sphingomonas sp. LaA6.9]
MKIRLNIYLDKELAGALDVLTRRPGTSRSRIINDAVAALLEREATKEVDGLLRPRLDRMQRDIALARRDIEILLESLSLFVRHQLTVTAALPEANSAAIALGRERFEAFVAEVGRQINAGRRAPVHRPHRSEQ